MNFPMIKICDELHNVKFYDEFYHTRCISPFPKHFMSFATTSYISISFTMSSKSARIVVMFFIVYKVQSSRLLQKSIKLIHCRNRVEHRIEHRNKLTNECQSTIRLIAIKNHFVNFTIFPHNLSPSNFPKDNRFGPLVLMITKFNSIIAKCFIQ